MRQFAPFPAICLRSLRWTRIILPAGAAGASQRSVSAAFVLELLVQVRLLLVDGLLHVLGFLQRLELRIEHGLLRRRRGCGSAFGRRLAGGAGHECERANRGCQCSEFHGDLLQVWVKSAPKRQSPTSTALALPAVQEFSR